MHAPEVESTAKLEEVESPETPISLNYGIYLNSY